MARGTKDQIVVSIDIGTTKICVLVGRKRGDQIEVIGVGKSPSYGLHKGVVVDVAKTISSISQAIKEAETMTGLSIDSACIGVSGAHISSLHSSGVIPIKNGHIKSIDIAHVLDAAQAIPLPQGCQILHVLPQYFIINGQDIVQDPLGMHAVRLEVQTHIIMGAVSSVQTLLYCCQSAGVTVTDIVLEQLASALAVLSPDELDLGVAVLDIGGGTSDFAVYKHSTVRHTKVIPVAGNHVTNDIALGLRIMKEEAEAIKKQYGVASLQIMNNEKLIEVEMMQGNDLQVICISDLVHIVECRMKELFTLVVDDINISNVRGFMSNGLVLTGGGSLLQGIQDLAEPLFNCPIRIGTPRVMFDLLETLQSPLYATGYGLLMYVMNNEKQIRMNMRTEPLTRRVFESMRMWLTDFF